MKRTTFIAAIASAAIGLTTVSAMAREKGPDFAALDADGNGEITLVEMQAAGDARFAAVDTDGDGFLTQEELEAAGKKRSAERAERMLKHMDENEDGKLSKDEMKPKKRTPEKFFDRVDTDKSGGISKAEFDEARAKMKERHGKKGHGKRHGDMPKDDQ